MKTVFVTAILLSAMAAQAETCKKGDIKDCARVIKEVEGKPEFKATYDQACLENKTFKCLKRTVRGDIKEEMGYAKQEFPKAHFFTTKEGSEDKLYILDKK